MKRLWLTLGLSLVLTSCTTPSCLTNLQTWPDPSGKHMNLQQCWDKHDQIRFYTTSQGSQIAPYDLVKHLQMPSSTEPFLSRANIEKWRFPLLEKTDVDADSDVDKDVPDWPLGLVIDDVTSGKLEWQGKWLGMTCAACHTTHMEYQSKKLRIDGGPTMANVNQFLSDLRAALNAMYQDGGKNGAKFRRYAQNFPGVDPKDLLTRLGAVLKERDKWHQRNNPPTPPGPPGFARLDAFGVIFNEVIHMTGKKPVGDPKTDAPVSYPFLWDTSHHNQTQWNGGSPAIPMARNIVQALGVFAKYDPEAGWFEEPSTIRLSNQRKIQELVSKLRSPKWPEGILGKIDHTMAADGKKLFESKEKNCRVCHAAQEREVPLERIKMTMTKVQDIKTDSKMVEHADHRRLSDQDGTSEELIGAAAGDAAIDIVFSLSHVGDVFAFLGEAISALFTPKKDLRPDRVPDDYKSRPLDGIWATAPYLHNGSVLNLYELLLPAKDRKKAFCVGSREFDPDRVGFVSVDNVNDCGASGGTWLDTALDGNTKTGHEYGACSDTDPECKKQILQLVEYMKTL